MYISHKTNSINYTYIIKLLHVYIKLYYKIRFLCENCRVLKLIQTWINYKYTYIRMKVFY